MGSKNLTFAAMATSKFSKNLLRWHATYDRNMPWKNRTDAYAIWLSEIILQQTRVAQGLPYYLRFLDKFPTVHDLAQADEQAVMKLWEGLGYYSRARNLHFTAKYISEQLDGHFPDTYKGLLTLKGVGPYTAAAIASFAFQLPHAVVDGNVFRVLARYTANFTDISSSLGRKEFTTLANQLLDDKQPAKFNQALMDLGAMICKPTKPNCTDCPVSGDCQALAQNIIYELPVKLKMMKRKTRYFHYFVFRKGQTIWIQKRTKKDIWQSLYEFPHIELDKSISEKMIHDYLRKIAPKSKEVRQVGPFTQLLTHQKIIGQFLVLDIKHAPSLANILPIEYDKLSTFPFPKMMTEFFAAI